MNKILTWLRNLFFGVKNVPHETIPPSEGNPPIKNGDTPWMDIAKKEIGVHEIRGGETARILEYHNASYGKFDEDEVPWCASFCNWVLDKVGFFRKDDPNDALAVSFATYGQKLSGPKIGCVLVFRWAGGGRHVAFCSDFTSDQVKALGGNQSDSLFGSGGAVNEKWQSRKFVTDYRWPVK